MKKIVRVSLFVLLGIVVVGTFVFLWNKSQKAPVVYEISTPVVQDISKRTVATGKIEPRTEVLIKPQISGIISHVYKEAGDKVQVGDVLALVKVIPEMNAINSAESQVKVAKIDLDKQQSLYDRNRALYDQKVISREDFEAATAAYQQAKQSHQYALDNLEIIREGVLKRAGSYGNTQIRSTISGTVLDVPVKVGNSVILSNTFNDGTTIASVADLSDMIFKGKIDETEVGRVKSGMPIVLTVGALQNLKFDAVLEYISPKGAEQNGAVMFEIRAAAHIPDSVMIRSGYSANAEIILQNQKDALSLPENTVSFENDSSFVYVLKSENGNKQEFERRPVKIGISDGINIEIVSGIDKDTKVRGIEKAEVKK